MRPCSLLLGAVQLEAGLAAEVDRRFAREPSQGSLYDKPADHAPRAPATLAKGARAERAAGAEGARPREEARRSGDRKQRHAFGFRERGTARHERSDGPPFEGRSGVGVLVGFVGPAFATYAQGVADMIARHAGNDNPAHLGFSPMPTEAAVSA